MSATLAGLLDAIANGPDLRDGNCVGRWDLWDTVDDPATTEFTISQCNQCPVLQRCASWSATLNDSQLCGVVAGVVHIHPSDRKRRKRAIA